MNWKWAAVSVTAIVSFTLALHGPAAMAAPGCGDEQTMPKGKTLLKSDLALIALQPALYRLGSRIFLGVQVSNRSKADIGIDLRNFHKTIFPNQWGYSDRDHREAIDNQSRAPS